jgi:hypothetical protein
MELLTQFIAPIVSLWVIHNTIFYSAGFVNKMRETVISGLYEGERITKEHRRAILIDWTLCIAATIAVCMIFAGIVLAISIALLEDYLMKWIGVAIAFYPTICAVGFLICSIADLKLMLKAVQGAARSRSSR